MSVTESFRYAVSEGSEVGMLIAADALEESDNPTDNTLGRLLRRYVDIQTYVRTSQLIPHELGLEYEQLSKTFDTRQRLSLGNWGCSYSKPLGPYYTELEARMPELMTHLHWITDNPVRNLVVTDCSSNDNFAMLIRNHRMDYMYNVTFRFATRTRDTLSLSKAIMEMKGSMLQNLTVYGVNDRFKQVQVAFLSARGIRKGASLHMSDYSYSGATRVCTKT